MGSSMAMRPGAMLPEILLFAGGLTCLLGGSFTPRHSQGRLRAVAVVALLASAADALLAGDAGTAFEGAYAVDIGTTVARVVVALATLVVVALAADEIGGRARESETYALLLFAAAGAVVLAGARDLLVLSVGFFLASIPLYALVGLERDAKAAEAALKTYLVGALFGIMMLLGVTLVHGVTGTTAYPELASRLDGAPRGVVAVGAALVLAGLMFKAGAVPAHFWVPDAAQGSAGFAAAFATTVPKVGAVVATFRIVTALPRLEALGVLVAVVAAASMTVGNLAAYGQQDPRRLLGWSTVSQVGYALVPAAVAGRSDLALPSVLLYLAGYAATNLAAFAVTTALPTLRTLGDWTGLSRLRPGLATCLVVALLGLVGTPPTIVFVGKLTTATAAWDGGMPWLTAVLLVNTVVSLFYYLRWFAPALRRSDDCSGAGPAGAALAARAGRPWSVVVAGVGAVASVLLGLLAGPLWQVLGSSALLP